MDFARIPLGDQAPEIVNAVIEIPRGSHSKYEYDEKLGTIRLDRILHSPVFYPADYGFLPQTTSSDGDSLDVLVLVSEPLFPGCLITVRPIGALDMADDKGQDEKIIAVFDKDPRYRSLQNISDIEKHTLAEFAHFFEVYKHLENKAVTVRGWLTKPHAYDLIRSASTRFSNSS